MNDNANYNEPELLTQETQEIPDTGIGGETPLRPAGQAKKPKRKTGASLNSSRKRRQKAGKHTGSKSAAKDGRRKASPHKKRKAAQKKNLSLHIALIALILLIGIFGLIRLLLWNRGNDSGYDPNEVTTEFDTEPEDYFVPQSSDTVSLQKDDGVTSILLLGNGALAATKKEEDSIGRQLEALTGGKVYDASINHSYLSVKNMPYDESYPADVFSLYWIAQCIASGDYTLLEDHARIWDGDPYVQETVEMLKSLDMTAIDTIVIMYDSHDYEAERILAGPYDDTLAATCCGCLQQALLLLQQAYPQARIIVSSPFFAYIEDGDGKLQPGSILNMGQGTLADYMIAYKNIAVNANVSFIDHYFGTITEDNYEKYLEDDKEHLNGSGRTAIAKRIASFIGSSN